MSFRSLALVLLLCCVTALVAGPALAGQGWELEFVGQDLPREQALLVHLDDQHLRLAPGGEDEEVILGPESIILVDNAARTWSTISYAELEAMLASFTAMMDGMMEEMKKNMTPEQIEAMEAEMGGMSAEEDMGGFEFRSTSDSETVAGLRAQVSEVYQDGALQGRMWTTTEVPIGLVNTLLDRIQSAVPEQFRKEMREVNGLHSLPGFPLRIVDTTNGEQEVVVVRRAERRDLGADVFAPPQGYSETESPLRKLGQGFGGMGGSGH